ncbi:S8 family serine peptidase [Alicyclobacillus macrosporangiidus]|uniref:Subtilase family protein n=1 Tax=Alicyclobacillus macrosporangiidus TaxID=392015 RepID=A0A1I7GV77_9BACL|nr:S8 family serine peptidase [Alicyclobacillus macrosporangiidus]SFU52322.1 Subtilase family protein [Alicyclobacillus macrosporangiidus]
MRTRRVVFATGHVTPNHGQGYFPEDIRRLYHFPADLDGTGQTIGLLEFSNGYNLRDARQFWTSHGITPPRVTFVSVDGTPNDGGRSPDDEEATLDLQWAGALAPGADIVVYEANAGDTYASFAQSMTRTLQYILHDTQHRPTVLSISYGDGEISFDPADLRQWADLIRQLDARGITVCIASGDQGAYGLHDPNGPKARHADAPASAPFAVAVGGTSLQPDGTETAWTYRGPENGGATGGGFSAVFAKPSYQSAIHGTGRGVPDVACNADPATGYQIIFQGQSAVVGGTSVSCPVFAAAVALANQRRAQRGLPPLSGLAALLYGAQMTGVYRDITAGDNTYDGVAGYAAGPGWDACTGFGSFDVSALVERLSQAESTASEAAVLELAPAAHAPEPAADAEPVSHPTPEREPVPVPESASPAPEAEPVPDPTPVPEPQPVFRRQPSLPRTDHEFIVRVKARIRSVEPDAQAHGAHHHRLLVDGIQVLKVWHGFSDEVEDRALVAIRYGDALGLPGPIPGLAAGREIELQGRYIPAALARSGDDGASEAVLDETHHPFGFVVYEGRLYR